MKSKSKTTITIRSKKTLRDMTQAEKKQHIQLQNKIIEEGWQIEPIPKYSNIVRSVIDALFLKEAYKKFETTRDGYIGLTSYKKDLSAHEILKRITQNYGLTKQAVSDRLNKLKDKGLIEIRRGLLARDNRRKKICPAVFGEDLDALLQACENVINRV